MKKFLVPLLFLSLLAGAVLSPLVLLPARGQVSSPYARFLAPSTFANLGTPSNGAVRYCSDCAATSPCAGSGSGATASRVGGAWNCSTGGSSVPAGSSGDIQTNNAGAFGSLTPGAGVSTFLATPSGANLASALTTALPVSKGGTNCTSATIACFNNITGFSAAGTTGTTSTNVVFSTSPSLTTPNIGAATATTVNGNTFTTGTYTLTGGAGKTFTFNNSLTFAGTDGTTQTFPNNSGTVPNLNLAQTFTTTQTFTPATNTQAVKIHPSGSQTADLLQVTSDGSTVRTRFDSAGRIGTRGLWVGGNESISGTLSYDELRFGDTAGTSWLSTNVSFRGGSTFVFGWASATNGIGVAADTGMGRNAAGVVEINSGTLGTLRDMKLRGLQHVTGTRPTCDSTTRGTTWYVAGGAGVADTYELCRKDAADAYAWVTLF
jgi:hypothetical protein